jgi:hypothetical protein
MRLLRLRIGREVDGGRLARVPALRRWVTMGSWIGLAGLLPLVDQLAGYAILAWSVVLLVTVLRSGTRQGFHDRVGRSVVLEPSTRTGHPLAVGCLTLVGILFALAVALGLAGFWNAMDAAGLAP